MKSDPADEGAGPPGGDEDENVIYIVFNIRIIRARIAPAAVDHATILALLCDD